MRPVWLTEGALSETTNILQRVRELGDAPVRDEDAVGTDVDAKAAADA